MGTMRFVLSLEGSDPRAVARSLLPRLPQAAPDRVTVDDEPVEPPPGGWVEALAGATYAGSAFWRGGVDHFLTYRPSGPLLAALDFERDAGAVAAWLDTVPFTVASFGTLYSEWNAQGYHAPGFGGHHVPLGWGCAFKGEGHDRLVSRRWLEYGPWKLLRGPGDLSVLVFHDLEAPPLRALEQARPAHQVMGISPVGGYIQPSYAYGHDIKGLYDSGDGTLRVVVHRRDVSPAEMLDYCAARRNQVLDRPLKRIAFVFLEPDRARRHLHNLWLRDLECWAVVDGFEQRLDDDYHPSPSPPAWTRR